MTANDRLRAAYAAYSNGDMATARNEGEAVLRAQPDNPGVLTLLGVVSCQAGDLPNGATYLRRAISHGGDNADNRINLAKALLEMGETAEALALCDGEIALASNELQRLRGDILKAEGRAGEAVWAYEDLIAANPDDFEAWNNLGNARHEAGDLEGALDALNEARRRNDKAPQVFVNLGRVLASMNRHEESCLMLEKAALLSPSDPAPLIELGRALVGIDHAEGGLRALGTAARLDPKNPRVFVAIGRAFNALSNLDQAEKSYRIALQVDPRHPPAYLDLAIMLEKANRLDELDGLLADATAAGVEGPEIAYVRALVAFRQNRLEDALDLLAGARSKAISASMLAQFQGQIADRLGRIDEAALYYEDMNRAEAESPLGVGKDRSAYRRAIEGFSAITTKAWYDSWKPGPGLAMRPSPAFLVGFPRSGTTLLDTILMGHSGTHVLEELPLIERIHEEVGGLDRLADLDADAVADLRAQYFAALDAAAPPPPGALVIDKNPLSMIRIPLIHRLFPDARIILAMRHPCDVVLSCYMQNFKPTDSMASFLDISNAALTYDRIFSYWEQCRSVLPLAVHELRYEALVADVEGAVRPLFDFLGLDWEAGVLDHQRTAKERGYIRTPSYAQVTEKIYASASGRWKRYESTMRDVVPVLEPWVDRFGYTL